MTCKKCYYNGRSGVESCDKCIDYNQYTILIIRDDLETAKKFLIGLRNAYESARSGLKGEPLDFSNYDTFMEKIKAKYEVPE